MPWFLLFSQLISILVHTTYSTLYFVLIQTEDDRSFCRNMFLKSVSRVVSENIIL